MAIKHRIVINVSDRDGRKVKCGTCGRAMPMKSGVVRGVDYRYFYCPHAASQVGDGGCTKGFAREDELNAVIWDSVKGLLLAVGDMKKKIGKTQTAAEKNGAGMVKKLADLQKEKAKCEAERFTNMDQFMVGNLDKETYQKDAVIPNSWHNPSNCFFNASSIRTLKVACAIAMPPLHLFFSIVEKVQIVNDMSSNGSNKVRLRQGTNQGVDNSVKGRILKVIRRSKRGMFKNNLYTLFDILYNITITEKAVIESR